MLRFPFLFWRFVSVSFDAFRAFLVFRFFSSFSLYPSLSTPVRRTPVAPFQLLQGVLTYLVVLMLKNTRALYPHTFLNAIHERRNCILCLGSRCLIRIFSSFSLKSWDVDGCARLSLLVESTIIDASRCMRGGWESSICVSPCSTLGSTLQSVCLHGTS